MNLSPDEVDSLESVAVAELDADAVLLDGNKGFLRLLDAGAVRRTGTRVVRFFVQPDFETLVALPPGGAGESYRGLLTIRDAGDVMRTLRGRVWRTDRGIRVIAEHDVEELHRLGDSMVNLTSAALFSQRAIGVENVTLKQREAQLSESALTDSLTGVGNRRRLGQALLAELERARRSGGSLSVVMVDIDHFKQVNDRHGHAGGDQVLVQFARLLQRNTRPSDILARFGGEEFVVLMPSTGLARAADVAERIRGALARERLAPLSTPLTSSFGVAELVDTENADALLERADAALYRAKDAGRDRVVLATERG